MSVEFLFIAEAGVLENQSLLLAESIRKFGGRYAQARITALQPRAERPVSAEGRRQFAALEVNLVELAITSPCPEYGTSYRVFACAEYERVATSDCLIFMDSDTVLLGEPDLELQDADVAARPVDVKGMCTTGAGDPNEPYWRMLAGLCAVPLERLPFVTTTVDRESVRASYNGGLTVVKTKAGLFAKTADFFARSINAPLVPWPLRTNTIKVGSGEVAPAGGRLWGSAQACFSLAITALGLSVRILPPSVNFPLHFHAELLPEILSGRIPAIRHIHYHYFFRESLAANPLFAGMPGIPADAEDWLRTRKLANIHAGKRLVLVLGMHRSGTSMLTKGLETMGVELAGDMMPADAGNPRGYWEDLGFYQLNEDLLGALDRNWADIGFLDTEAVGRLCEGPWLRRALELIHTRFDSRPVIGIKDPRFCVLMPFWNQVFRIAGIEVSHVLMLRDPRSVAASLKKREARPEAQGLWLWWLYYAQLFEALPHPPAVVVDYDQLMDAAGPELRRVARALGLPLHEDRLAAFENEFIDASLRHTRYRTKPDSSDPDETHPAFATYAALKSLATAGAPDAGEWAALPEQWKPALGASRSLLEMNSALFAERWNRWKERTATVAALTARDAKLEARLRRFQNCLGWPFFKRFLRSGNHRPDTPRKPGR